MASKLNERVEQQPGSILAEKHFEPSDAMLQAYEARLKPLETLEKRYRKYPDLALEVRQFEIYQKFIEVAQALDQLIKKTPSLHIEPDTKTHTKEGEHLGQLGKQNPRNERK